MFLSGINGSNLLIHPIRRYLFRRASYSYANPLHLQNVLNKLEQLKNLPVASGSAQPGSVITFEIKYADQTCETAQVRLADTHRAIQPDDVSVLSPLGALLLGSHAGDIHEAGGIRNACHLKVLDISQCAGSSQGVKTGHYG